MQTPRSLRSQWRADDPAGIADDEGHLVWRRMDGGEDQVALVLAVIIISDDDDLPAGECVDDRRDTGLGHGLISHRG